MVLQNGKNFEKISLSVSHLKQKGLTFLELLAAVGIISILTGMIYIGYGKYVLSARLGALHRQGTHILNQMQKCVEESILSTGRESILPVDMSDPLNGDTTDPEDWKGCGSKEALELQQCEECKNPKASAGSICIRIEKGELNQCVGYTPGDSTYRMEVTVDRGTCAYDRTGGRHSAVWPYKVCGSDSDCTSLDSNLKCIAGRGQCTWVSGVARCR